MFLHQFWKHYTRTTTKSTTYRCLCIHSRMTYGVTADKLLLCEARKCLTIAMFWPLLGTVTDEWDFFFKNFTMLPCLRVGTNGSYWMYSQIISIVCKKSALSVVKACIYSLPLDCAQSVHAASIFSISGTFLESIAAQFCAKSLFKQLNFANR